MSKNICKICGEKKKIQINKNDFFLRIDSSDKKLIDYKNFVCVNCGNIYHFPDISKKKLIKHYQTNYRNTDSVINLDKRTLDLPIRFDWTTVSFHRFHAFYETIKKNRIIKSNKKLKILDYGCYQGAFLYSCKKIFNFKTIGTDYNKEGLNLAKSIFLVDEVFETKENFFKKKINADIISLLHVLEHLSDPVDFLIRIKKNVLKKNGLLYLELPNPFTNPLNDPTHLNLYSAETIKYILKSCNYKVLSIEQRGLYKRGALLRNSKKLNLHILAQSLSQKKVDFKRIMIGNKIYSKLLKDRRSNIYKIFVEQTKYFFSSTLRTLYSFIFLTLNYFFPNFAVKLHIMLKNLLK